MKTLLIGLFLPHTVIFLTDAITFESCREQNLIFLYSSFYMGFTVKRKLPLWFSSSGCSAPSFSFYTSCRRRLVTGG